MAGKSKAGPVVTDNGNFLLDWHFNLEELKAKLSNQVLIYIHVCLFKKMSAFW